MLILTQMLSLESVLFECKVLPVYCISSIVKPTSQFKPSLLCGNSKTRLFNQANLFLGNLDAPVEVEILFMVVLLARVDAGNVVVAYCEVLAQWMHLVMASVFLNGFFLFQEYARYLVVVENGRVVVACKHSRPRDVEGLDHLVGCSVQHRHLLATLLRLIVLKYLKTCQNMKLRWDDSWSFVMHSLYSYLHYLCCTFLCFMKNLGQIWFMIRSSIFIVLLNQLPCLYLPFVTWRQYSAYASYSASRFSRISC